MYWMIVFPVSSLSSLSPGSLRAGEAHDAAARRHARIRGKLRSEVDLRVDIVLTSAVRGCSRGPTAEDGKKGTRQSSRSNDGPRYGQPNEQSTHCEQTTPLSGPPAK